LFRIRDERHDDWRPGEFATRSEAVAELQRLAAIPWDEAPNLCPCTGWRHCARHYELVEIDPAVGRGMSDMHFEPYLTIGAEGVEWVDRPRT
jgi:hypothetical protein